MIQVSAMDFTKCLASLRHPPSHAKARSTTHWRGRTSKPFALSVRLMISSVQRPIFFKRPSAFNASRRAADDRCLFTIPQTRSASPRETVLPTEVNFRGAEPQMPLEMKERKPKQTG